MFLTDSFQRQKIFRSFLKVQLVIFYWTVELEVCSCLDLIDINWFTIYGIKVLFMVPSSGVVFTVFTPPSCHIHDLVSGKFLISLVVMFVGIRNSRAHGSLFFKLMYCI